METRAFESSALQEILRAEPANRVSITLPTHRHGKEALLDATRFRTLLQEARRQLLARATPKDEVERILSPLEETLDDDGFWAYQEEGLVALADAGEARFFRLPHAVDERVTVAERFSLHWLLPLLSRAERFFVVALSIKETRVVEGTPAGVRRVEVELPGSMQEALGYEQYDTSLQVHSAGSPGPFGHQRGIMHGHGDEDADRHDRNVVAYFRLVVDALDRALPADAPWVLAAIDRYLPAFNKAAGDDQRIAAEMVSGNPELLSDAELAERARPIARELADRERLKAIRRLELKAGTPEWTAELSGLVTAARQGRVDSLFVGPEAPELWGVFDPVTNGLEIREEPEPGDEDLIESAVFHTLRTGGQVWPVAAGELPVDGSAVALLRY
jgi:hypothetical protein